MIGLDTNVLVRFLVKDEPRQAERAVEFIRSSCTAEEPCFINRIVLSEFVWVLTSVYRYRRDVIAQVVEHILRAEELGVENADEAWAALKDYRAGEADFADGLLGKVNRALGCAATATFDLAAGRLEDFILLGGEERRLP